MSGRIYWYDIFTTDKNLIKSFFCAYGTTLHMCTHLCREYNSWFRKWSFPFSHLVKNPYATTLLRFGVVLWTSLEIKRSTNEVKFILATQISINLYFATFFSEHMIKKLNSVRWTWRSKNRFGPTPDEFRTRKGKSRRLILGTPLL